MKVAVTGGLGFIGSHFVEVLVKLGFQTVVIDDSSTGRIENLGPSRGSPRLKVLNVDVRNPAKLREAVDGVDTVVHAAAMTSVQRSFEVPVLTEQVNVRGTINVLDASVAASVRRLVFLSSAAVYGDAKPPAEESAPPRPLSPYASSKVSGEKYCRDCSEEHGIETVILRPFNVYGPRMTGGRYGGAMIRFAEATCKGEPLTVYGDGEQTRDFVHVDDVAGALLLALDYPGPKGEVFNVGTGIGTTVNELANLFVESSGRRLEVVHGPPRKGEVRHSVADRGKAESKLRFKTKVALKRGVVEYLRWYGRFAS